MSLRVFIIDDEECIRDSLKWYLEDLGHEVLTAPEPTSCEIYQGHDCSQEHPCGDALIIDYNMPKMNGLEFIELMKHRGCKGLTSNKLVISGNSVQICRNKVAELGCALAQKPISFAELDSWLEEVKAKRKSSDGHTNQSL